MNKATWVTWFIDCATNAVTGAAVTPHQPSRDAILAALRIAVSRDEPDGPYGPLGGLPSLVRIDRGADFLSRTVADALGHFAVPVQDLPPYRPELKGTVENLNCCAEKMFFASLPRYTHAPSTRLRPGAGSPQVEETDPLPFTEFVRLLLQWVTCWNTEHVSQALKGRTPLEAWRADPTPLEDVDPCLLHRYTLADDGRTRTLTTSGVRWRNRYYVGEWMHGGADAGTRSISASSRTTTTKSRCTTQPAVTTWALHIWRMRPPSSSAKPTGVARKARSGALPAHWLPPRSTPAPDTRQSPKPGSPSSSAR